MIQSLAIAVLAAGKGTRMGGNKPKCMHEIAGKPMVLHAIDTAKLLEPDHILCITGSDQPDLTAVAAKADATIVHQEERLGTAHAAMQLQPALQDFKGVLILTYGDTPLVPDLALEQLIMELEDSKVACAVLGFHAMDPTGYGRLVQDKAGYLNAIVEEKDATESQKEIDFVNSGVMAMRAPQCWDFLAQISNNNAAKEYYLPDYVEVALKHGYKASVVEISESEAQGVNTPMQLAMIETHMQDHLRLHHLQHGVVMRDPASVYFSTDTVIEAGVTIEPFVFFGPKVHVKTGSIIKGFSHIEGATIEENAQIGPYARLRPDTIIEQNARIGNFVEIKKSTISTGAKVNHLSYIGDSSVGAKTNIGAGTITCNYDGFNKFKTIIGDDVFVGSNSLFIAPVTVGDGSTIGAGSVITTDVEKDSLAITRAVRKNIANWSKKFREKNKK